MYVVSLRLSRRTIQKRVAVPKTVKTRKMLKKVKKKFLEMTDSSTSPWLSMPGGWR